ncbi:pro-epidermal growth factor-like [Dendronephthya gigantea]|uniref:pro-epidermal growth factor-like n=1 Tax=Dendronephthya gigantea TaxID=151771 RepID=UPI00106ABF09|nr:pro-epidermal growth factor-like [Dendronephthya gigantea]
MGNQWFLYFLLFTLENNGEEIEYILYSNATHISYVSIDGGKSKALVKTPSATLGYDELNYRLWYYKDGEKLYNSNLDGSDLKNVSVPSNFGPFAVDAVNQSIYYLTKTDFNLKLIDYDGNDLPDIGVSPDNDFRDLQIDAYNRTIFFTTDVTNNRNLIRYSLADGTDQTLHSGVTQIGTHLALDTVNKTIYWILFTSETNYKILKTTYDGQTSQIGTDQSGSITTVDIADGNGYYYILDTTTSKIYKYYKSTDTVATTISLVTEATRMVVVSDKDHCSLNNICPANSTCTNSPGTIVCSCDTGFTGNQTYCQDIDECTNGSCDYNANCTNTVGSYTCQCLSGYKGNGTNCIDIDECAEGDPCGFNTNCTNIGDSYTCECLSGFEGNGTNCTDINECETIAPCHSNATCTNVDGSYDCVCKANYSGDGLFCEVLTCQADALYYATTDAIKGVFSDGNTTVTILSATNVKLNYDSGTKRLLYYDGTSLITVKLDGSNATTIASLSTIFRFTVDHIARKVYYVTELFKSLNVIDLNTGNTAGLNPTNISNVVDLDCDPDSSSLVFADATRGDIVRYFLDKDTNEVVYHNDTSPKYLTVDPQYEVIYWIDYIAASDSFSLMKTYFNGSTSEVKFYSGTTSSVNVAKGKDNFYVMDSTRKRIDVFDRPTAAFQDSFFLSDSPQEITVVEDLDECCVGGYCHDNATCTNTPGSYFCTCKEGYTGIGTNCEDIDECTQGDPCGYNANCTNTDGSYTCECLSGYKGNKRSCIDKGGEIEYIFYTNATHISYVSIDGGESKALVKTPSATLAYDELNYRLWYYKDGEKLYYSNLDGSDLKNVSVPSNFGPFAVDAANQSVYYLTKSDFNLKLIDYDGNDLPDIGVSPDNDFRDLQIDPYNRAIFFTTDITNNRNLIRYSLAIGTDQTLDSGVTEIGTHLALDIVNKTVYWILFTSETNYKILKTTYDGQTSQIGTDQSGSITTVDIADGNGYYYILDTTTSQIDKYDKSTDTVATTISLSTEATRIIVVFDKDHCSLNNTCPANSTCTNSPGTIVCSCDTGFTGNQTYCQVEKLIRSSLHLDSFNCIPSLLV